MRDLLDPLPAEARTILRRYLVADQPDREALAQRLLRERTETGDLLAELLDGMSLESASGRQALEGPFPGPGPRLLPSPSPRAGGER